jgi:hypothetical protein
MAVEREPEPEPEPERERERGRSQGGFLVLVEHLLLVLPRGR